MKARLLLGVAIFLGLPLIGWGLGDVRGFLAEPARLGYLLSVGLIQLVAAIWFPEALKESGAGEKTVTRQRLVIYWLQMASFAVVLAAPWTDRHAVAVLGGGALLRTVGLGLAVPGFVLMLWSRAALGRQFSYHVTLQKEHLLVTTGLYRFVRHPRYAGILLFFAGTSLVYRSGLAVLVTAISAGVLGWRIWEEEQMMQREFGERWEAYCRRTWRLLPPVF